MNELEKYVNSLFIHHKNDDSLQDLKDEIYGNLEAKKQDLLLLGMDEASAIKKAKESITSIEGLIEGNRLIYVNRFKKECLQSLLFYLTIVWILTIPLIVFSRFSLLNTTLLIAVICVGIAYVVKKPDDLETIGFINLKRYQKRKRLAWILWGIFYGVCVLFITALFFGSNLWFSRPIRINGPYAFAYIAAQYFVPLLTIFIPILISDFTKIILKNEVREN